MVTSMIGRETAKSKEQFLYVPEGFDPATAGRWADCTAYVLSTINRRLVFEQLDPDGYVPLMSALLKRVLPKRDYRKILQLLIDLDVIECDRSYQVGTKSKGYRLTGQYRGQPHRRYLITDSNLLAKTQKLREDMGDGVVLPVHRHLWSFLQKIDLSQPLPDLGTFNLHVHDILDQDFRFLVCQYGRVHTNLTNMPKVVRKYIRFQGKELSNLDIANSQPLFLGVVVLNHYINKSYLQTATSFTAEQLYLNLPELLPIHGEGERREGEGPPLCGNIPHDLTTYLEVCQNGRLYEYLMEKAGLSVDRDEFKKVFFQVLFGPVKLMNLLPLAAVFQEQFPTVMAVMREIKKKDYRHISNLLQRTESSFVINRVVRRLMNEHPAVFVSTIHDSFVVPTEDVPLVRRVVLEEFARLGLRPTLKVERLVAAAADSAAA